MLHPSPALFLIMVTFLLQQVDKIEILKQWIIFLVQVDAFSRILFSELGGLLLIIYISEHSSNEYINRSFEITSRLIIMLTDGGYLITQNYYY